MLVRRCVACGYDGALLDGGHAAWCARCGCDLRARPARSYAEMENLVGQPLTLHTPKARSTNESRLIERWLLFVFLVLLGFVAVVALAAAAAGL
jgi:hypothetical protein